MKTYLDKLIEKLKELRNADPEPRVEKVLETVCQVIIDSKLPGDFRKNALMGIMAADGLTLDEHETLKELDATGYFND